MGTSQRSWAAVIALVLAGVAGCSGARNPTTGAPGTPTAATKAATPRADPADAQFLSGMIHHHAQAILMSEWSATHGASEQIRTLSQRIIVSQRDEIKSMQLWLRDHGEPTPEPSAKGQRMMMDGVEHTM